MSSASNTPPDDYYIDAPRNVADGARNKRPRASQDDSNRGQQANNGGDSASLKPKRIACIICRKRKLKCDGIKPNCSTCSRLGHDCSYDEVRRKSGPKRGYVKALEERLKQVETLLKTQNPSITVPEVSQLKATDSNIGLGALTSVSTSDFNVPNANLGMKSTEATSWGFNETSPQAPMDNINFQGDMDMGIPIDDSNFTWEMIGLGLEEPLPPQDTIDELHQIYFDKIHPSLPMVHKFRYLAAMNLAPNQRPPVCLRYAMWTHAASITDRFADLKVHFYQRARKYVELDYMKGHGEGIISIAHAQTHILLASYEFRMMFFPRAWMSTGSAVRLSQMMSLHKLDGAGLDVKQTIPNPRDWTEREERRRTFWMAFCQDRYASIGTGWPMTIDEKDISTDLPASDEAFNMSKPEGTQSLSQAMSPSGASKLSSYAGVVLMASLFGRNLIHLHRPDPNDRDDDLNGEFWKRHRHMDNTLLNTSLSMPSHFRLPNGLSNPNIVFTNMNIHTSTICLHQAAIYKADKNNLPASISAESKVRCITAANEIASVMRMISHIDLLSMNPFISFCLYVAARVFIQYIRSRPEDSQTGDSLRFLLSAMNALKKKNPLTESFLVQLDVDLESLGARNEMFRSHFACNEQVGYTSAKQALPTQVQACNSLMPISEDSPVENDRTNGTGSNLSKDGPTVDYSDPAKRPSQQRDWSAGSRQDLRQDLQDLELNTTYGSEVLNHNPFGRHDGGHSTDTGISSDTASNRPTPNSTTPSDTQHTRSSNGLNPHNQTSSYSTSPSSTTYQQQHHQQQQRAAASGLFSNPVDFSTLPANIGLTPEGMSSSGVNVNGNYGLPETPDRGFEVPNGWEMSGSGMTPVGEGVFRHLMGLGMDQMDIGWENNP